MPETRELKLGTALRHPADGSSGRPERRVLHDVPESPVGVAFCMSTSSSAAVRGGRVGVAFGRHRGEAAAPSTIATTAPGTAQRSAGRLVIKPMRTHPSRLHVGHLVIERHTFGVTPRSRHAAILCAGMLRAA